MREEWMEGEGVGVVERLDPEVRAGPERRRFPAAYKARIVREAEACRGPGEAGALLRREGLYSSQLALWRKQMRAGALSGLEKTRGRKKDPDAALRRRVGELEKDNAQLKRELRRAETVIEVQKKLSEMLGVPLESGRNG